MKKSFSSKFDKVVAKSQEKPIVIQFFATWCGPCRTLSPIMQELARLAKGKWELILIDVEKYPTIAGMYQVASIPTVHILHKGQSIANFAGVKSANTIEKWLKVNLPKSKKKKSNRYTEAERLLKQGNIPAATIQLLGMLHEAHPEEAALKILLALQYLGQNNPQATQLMNELDRKGELKAIAKQLQTLIAMEVEDQDEHTPTSSPYTSAPELAESKIDLANFDHQLLAQLVHYGINSVRIKKGLPALRNHSVLTAAATEQNQYQIKNDVLSHTQNNSDKRTVMDRVVRFGGGFRTVGENVQYQGMQLMRWSNRQEVVTDTYINTAKKLVDNWVKSPGHYKNLISQKFTYVGTAIGWNPENHAIFATQAFGG